MYGHTARFMFLQRIAKKASEERIVHVEAEHLNLRR